MDALAGNPTARKPLPELGDWDGPLYGELGVLATDGQRVECHMCGGWYKLLPSHVWRAHGATAAEYRALFGLAAKHGLVSADLSARLREYALQIRSS